MRESRKNFTSYALIAVAAIALPASAQQPAPKRPARSADGKPNLNGIWQALYTANWDLLGHAAQRRARAF